MNPSALKSRPTLTDAIAGVAVMILSLALPASGSTTETVTVSDAWSPAPPPGARTAAVYLTLENGAGADRIIGVRSELAATAELHTHVHADGMMRMQKLDDIEVPAGGAVIFRPHGLHIMLIDLQRLPEPGQSIDVTLILAHAGEVSFSAEVRDLRR
jgi:copper(I)-binding protein